jgi:hypothetical protein
MVRIHARQLSRSGADWLVVSRVMKSTTEPSVIWFQGFTQGTRRINADKSAQSIDMRIHPLITIRADGNAYIRKHGKGASNSRAHARGCP